MKMECTMYLADDCNLECKYCYEGRNKKYVRASAEIIKNNVEMIRYLSRDLNEKIDITFLGGEPMLNKEGLYLAVELLEKKLGNKVNYSITTNGTCCEKHDIDFMNEKDFDISLSIDGKKKTHEKNRISKNNMEDNLYEKTIEILGYALKKRTKISVRMTVASNNVNELYENIMYFFDKGVRKYDIAFNEFENWSIKSLNSLEKQLFLIDKWYLENHDKIEYVNLYDGKLTFFIVKRESMFCSAGTEEHFTINSEGSIYPCGYVCNDPYWEIGKTSSIGINKKEFNNKIRNSIKKQSICVDCEINFACIGSRCGFKNYKLTGKLNGPSQNLCKLEKILYKHNELVFYNMYNNKDIRFEKIYKYALEEKYELSDWLVSIIKQKEMVL